MELLKVYLDSTISYHFFTGFLYKKDGASLGFYFLNSNRYLMKM